MTQHVRTGLTGVGPALLTPRKANGRVDDVVTGEYVTYLVDQGVPLLFAAGTYGEGPLLDDRELGLLLEAAATAAAGRATLIANIGTASTAASVERARIAVDTGADLVASTPPYYYGQTDSSVREYFTTLDRLGAPLVIYNNPYRTGFTMSVELIARLAEELNVVAVKEGMDTPQRYQRLIEELPAKTTLLVGVDDLLMQGLALGAGGGVAVLASLFPRLFIDLHARVSSGDLHEAAKLQARITAVRSRLARGPYISTYKALSNLLGMSLGPSAAPLENPNSDELAKILDELNALPFWSELAPTK